MTTLSLRSRITSSSYSFQPMTDSSIIISWIKESSIPRAERCSNSSMLKATPPPVPPRVKLGRITAGRPISPTTSRASSKLCPNPLRGTSRPIRRIASLKSSRSSALRIASWLAPIISTPNFSSTPISATWMAVFSPVCPPRVGSRACGFSRSIIFATISGVTGSM